MSTILRALRRLEQEKDDATQRAHLRDEVVAPAAPRRRRVWPVWTAAGVVALGLLATAAFVLLAPAPGPHIDLSLAPPPPPVAAAPAAVVSPQPPVAVPAAQSTPPVTAPERVSPPPPIRELPAQVQAAPEPAYEEALEPSTPPEPADDLAVTVVRTALPDFVLQRTVWHPRPERREAHVSVAGVPVIQVLHEGDSLGPLRVETITPSAAIFSHGDVTIHRRVGEK